MHTNTIKHRRDTDVRVSHVPPLPSIYKVERRGWRRRENSNGFNFFFFFLHLKRKLKRTDAKQTNKKHPLGFHHTWHCILHPTVIKGGGFMRRRDRISTRPSCSWCDFTVFAKVQTGAFIFFFSNPHTTHRPVHVSIKPWTLCANGLGASNPPGHVTDVHLERLQYASHTLHTHLNANGEYSGMTPQLTMNKCI